MKVLMISDVYFPRVNGVSTSIQTFRRELASLGHQVDLIAPAYPAGQEDDPGIHRVASRRVPFDPEDRMMYARDLRAMLPRLRREAYDLVHIQTPFVAHYAGIEIAGALGIPRVESYHTFFEEYLFHYVPLLPRDVLRGLSRRFSRTQCNRMDALVVPSIAMRDKLGEYGVTAPIHVIPTGIPVNRFSGGDRARFRLKHGIPQDRPVLLFVGRVAHEKNIEFLFHAVKLALAEHPGLLFVIAGEGPALDSLKRLGGKLGLGPNLLFVGYLDRATDLMDCYRAADAFIFASRTETQGLVLLEAMALGVPVISTAVMGTRDVVGPKRGALVPEDDVADFAASIRTLIGDPALRARLAQEGRAYVTEWHADALAMRLAAAWQEVIDQRSGAARLAA
ncbi:MAG TPA: glycosyltransferase [Burkholderiales bacterium]|jgi:glycosyltransferase involved in cell wall biosynthesis|nr:glycosyltransferase [Burkholderiales bacterium]